MSDDVMDASDAGAARHDVDLNEAGDAVCSCPLGAECPEARGFFDDADDAEADEATRFTDAIGAGIFVREHGENLRYCPTSGWFIWAATRWERNDLRPVSLAMETSRGRAKVAVRMQAEQGVINSLLKKGTIENIVSLARDRLSVAQTDFDADPWLFNCANGTIDLRTGELRPHRRADLCTKQSPVHYDPAAACPTWDAFFAEVIPDAEIRAFVQRFIGLAMLGEVREHKLPVFHGRGANGKSTFLEAVQHVFGDYARAVSSNVLMARDGEAHPTEQAQLLGLRLAVCSETKQGRSFDEGTVKTLTGGDRISARFMRKDHFEFTPTHSLVLATNHKPKIKGTDEGIWRRLLLVPWTVTVPEGKRDTTLGAKLRAEASGILRWCVDGFRAWLAQGLAPPAAVSAATNEYRAESDLVGTFIADRCTRAPGLRAQSSALYQAFTAWCAAGGEKPPTQTTFSKTLVDVHGLENRKSGGVMWWLDLGLNAPQGGSDRYGERDDDSERDREETLPPSLAPHGSERGAESTGSEGGTGRHGFGPSPSDNQSEQDNNDDPMGREGGFIASPFHPIRAHTRTGGPSTGDSFQSLPSSPSSPGDDEIVEVEL